MMLRPRPRGDSIAWPPALFLPFALGCPLLAAETPPPAATLSTDDTSITVRVINDRPVVTSLLCPTTNFDWASKSPAPIPLIESAETQGRPTPLRWKFSGETATPREHIFKFVNDNPPLELDSIWTTRGPGPGPIEHRMLIFNRGKDAVLLPVQTSLALEMNTPPGHALEQSWVDKGAGTPTPDGMHRQALTPGSTNLLRCWPSGRDKPRDPIPWTSVQDVNANQGWYAGVEFTARVQIATKMDEAKPEAPRPLHVDIALQPDEKLPF